MMILEYGETLESYANQRKAAMEICDLEQGISNQKPQKPNMKDVTPQVLKLEKS